MTEFIQFYSGHRILGIDKWFYRALQIALLFRQRIQIMEATLMLFANRWPQNLAFKPLF